MRTRREQNLALCLGFILILSGCAPKKQTPSPATSPGASSTSANSLVNVETVSSFQEAISALSESSITCENEETCPEQVGLFLAADPAGGFDPAHPSVAACTSFLVGPDLAITNSHCIPSAVKLLPDLCEERIKIIFPGNKKIPEEIVECQQLIGHSERNTPISPDIALLRLKRKLPRAPLPISREGVLPGSSLQVFRVTPSSGNRHGTLSASTCQTAERSYRMPVFTSQKSSQFVVGDCQDVPGNSGSPVLGKDGKVQGLLQASLPISDRAKSEWSRYLLHPEDAIAPLAMGTSLHCLKTGPENGEFLWNPDCQNISEEEVPRLRTKLIDLLQTEEAKNEIQSALLPYLGQTSFFDWARAEVSARSLERLETIRPACLSPVSKWENLYREGNSFISSAELRVQAPLIRFSMSFNRYLQPLPPQIKIEGNRELQFQFSPHAAAESSFVTLIPPSGDSITLRSCGDPTPSSDPTQ